MMADRERNNGPYWFGDKKPKGEYQIATIARIRTDLVGLIRLGKDGTDLTKYVWQLEMMVRGIDSLKEYETDDEAKYRAHCTPSTLLSDEEIATLLPSESQERHREFVLRKEREAKCSGHEMVSTSTTDESRRGWHKGHCKHCGADMSYDSGD
jgi:hypothetical protein